MELCLEDRNSTQGPVAPYIFSVLNRKACQPEFGAYQGLARVLKSPSNLQNCRKKQKILEKGTILCAKLWYAPIPGSKRPDLKGVLHFKSPLGRCRGTGGCRRYTVACRTAVGHLECHTETNRARAEGGGNDSCGFWGGRCTVARTLQTAIGGLRKWDWLVAPCS